MSKMYEKCLILRLDKCDITINDLQGACVANAGKMIHDGVGKYVLPSKSIIDVAVLVLSDRCQFGCHGEACERMWRT